MAIKSKQNSRNKKRSTSVFTRLLAHRNLLAVVAIMMFSGVGAYLIDTSSAAATLTRGECEIRGRKYSFIKGQDHNKAVKCEDKCQTGAGKYITKKGQRGYCTNAISAPINKATCSQNGRVYVGDSGCARRWSRNQAKGVVQCIYSSHTYWIASPDYCAVKKRVAKSYVGRDGFGGGQCTDYIKYTLARHSPRYKPGSYGNGKEVARNLGRLGYVVNNVPAVHATVSMSSSQSAGHVALVAEIKADGSIVVEESNWSVTNAYGTHTISASEARRLTYAHTEVDWR